MVLTGFSEKSGGSLVFSKDIAKLFYQTNSSAKGRSLIPSKIYETQPSIPIIPTEPRGLTREERKRIEDALYASFQLHPYQGERAIPPAIVEGLFGLTQMGSQGFPVGKERDFDLYD